MNAIFLCTIYNVHVRYDKIKACWKKIELEIKFQFKKIMKFLSIVDIEYSITRAQIQFNSMRFRLKFNTTFGICWRYTNTYTPATEIVNLMFAKVFNVPQYLKVIWNHSTSRLIWWWYTPEFHSQSDQTHQTKMCSR